MVVNELTQVMARLLTRQELYKLYPSGSPMCHAKDPKRNDGAANFCTRIRGHEGLHIDHFPIGVGKVDYLVWSNNE